MPAYVVAVECRLGSRRYIARLYDEVVKTMRIAARMKRQGGTVVFLVLMAAGSATAQEQLAPMRPPAVPLVAHDPYFSIWSMADRLNDAGTVHWTGKANALWSVIRIDGKTYRIMGRDRQASPELQQTQLTVLPTRTIYEFEGAGMRVGLTFFTPALPEDLDVLSRPLTYIEWAAAATDGREHDVRLYFEAASDLVVNTPEQPVLDRAVPAGWRAGAAHGIARAGGAGEEAATTCASIGAICIWPRTGAQGATAFGGARQRARAAFEADGKLPDSDDLSGAPTGNVLAYSIDLGRVGARPASRYLMLAYDDLYSIEYLERKERAWWRRNGADAADLLRAARREHDALDQRSKAFDAELMADLRRVGGERYARLAVLAYRQTLAAHKLVADIDGTPMYFPKENFSQRLHLDRGRDLSQRAVHAAVQSAAAGGAASRRCCEYARLARWQFPFAPHDLGTYPLANGQVYGGGERTEENQMPVEESGNMLILLAALARVEGNAAFANRYWPQVTKWAEYLKEKGLDPENQLSTDDFAGHLAHNANLSIKAILALGSYAHAGGNDGAEARWRHEYRTTAAGVCEEVGGDGGRWRPLPAGVRQAGHVEPEVQPGVGQAAGSESVSAGGGANGDRVRPDAS